MNAFELMKHISFKGDVLTVTPPENEFDPANGILEFALSGAGYTAANGNYYNHPIHYGITKHEFAQIFAKMIMNYEGNDQVVALSDIDPRETPDYALSIREQIYYYTVNGTTWITGQDGSEPAPTITL